MKGIKFEGANAKGRVSAAMVGSGEVNVQKISKEGMLFETTNKLNIKGRYRFKIKFGDNDKTLSAKVSEVLWKSTVKKNKRQLTLYQVAAEFEKLKDDEKAFLDAIFDELIEDEIPQPDEGMHGVKMRVKE